MTGTARRRKFLGDGEQCARIHDANVIVVIPERHKALHVTGPQLHHLQAGVVYEGNALFQGGFGEVQILR